MTDVKDDLELVRGSGNVFTDFGRPDAEASQLRTILAAKIIGVLDDQKCRKLPKLLAWPRPIFPASATRNSFVSR
jgi:hypothetical protein